MLPVAIRSATNDDIAFIRSAWLRHLRGERSVRFVRDDVLFEKHGALVGRLLFLGRALIAHEPGDLQHNYGFVAFDAKPGVVHWIYVKGVYRRMGVGRALWKAAGFGKPVAATHATDMAFGMMGAAVARYGVTYDPYLLEDIR